MHRQIQSIAWAWDGLPSPTSTCCMETGDALMMGLLRRSRHDSEAAQFAYLRASGRMQLSFAAIRSFWFARTRWEQAALGIGGVILLFVSVRVFVAPAAKTVYPIFSSSSILWWE